MAGRGAGGGSGPDSGDDASPTAAQVLDLEAARRRRRASQGTRTWNDLVLEFLGRYDKEASRKTYGKVLRRLLTDLHADLSGQVSAEAVTGAAAFQALAHRAKDKCESTFTTRKSIVRRFLKWLEEQEVVPASTLREFEDHVDLDLLDLLPAGRRRPPLSGSEFECLVRAPGLALRERAFWRLVWDTAANPSLLLDAVVDQVDLARRRVTLVTSQGPAAHEFSVETAGLLGELVRGKAPDAAVFASRRGGPLKYRTAAELIAKATGKCVTLQQLCRPLAEGDRGA